MLKCCVLIDLAVTSVSITVQNALGPVSTDTTYNVGADGPTLTCTTTPVPEALDTATPLVYEFLVRFYFFVYRV